MVVETKPDHAATGRAAAGVRRAGTIVRSPLESRKDKKDIGDGDMSPSDVSILSLFPY